MFFSFRKNTTFLVPMCGTPKTEVSQFSFWRTCSSIFFFSSQRKRIFSRYKRKRHIIKETNTCATFFTLTKSDTKHRYCYPCLTLILFAASFCSLCLPLACLAPPPSPSLDQRLFAPSSSLPPLEVTSSSVPSTVLDIKVSTLQNGT